MEPSRRVEPVDGPSARATPWYVEAFRGPYLAVYAHRSDVAAVPEADFAIRALGLAPGDRVLDLACGAGRHSRRLVARGLRVVGLDLSADLLAAARRAGEPRDLVRGDMRALPFPDGAFAAVLQFFTSFGYFPDEAEDRQVLGEIARVLRPGGGLFLDLPRPETTVVGLVAESRRETPGGDVVEERRRIVGDGRRVEKDVRIVSSDGRRSWSWTESVRLYSEAELRAMLEGAGLSPTAWYGDLAGAPSGPEAPRLVVVARKA